MVAPPVPVVDDAVIAASILAARDAALGYNVPRFNARPLECATGADTQTLTVMQEHLGVSDPAFLANALNRLHHIHGALRCINRMRHYEPHSAKSMAAGAALIPHMVALLTAEESQNFLCLRGKTLDRLFLVFARDGRRQRDIVFAMLPPRPHGYARHARAAPVASPGLHPA